MTGGNGNGNEKNHASADELVHIVDGDAKVIMASTQTLPGGQYDGKSLLSAVVAEHHSKLLRAIARCMDKRRKTWMQVRLDRAEPRAPQVDLRMQLHPGEFGGRPIVCIQSEVVPTAATDLPAADVRILGLLVDGTSKARAAETLGLTADQLNAELRRIKQTMGCRTAAQLGAESVWRGIVETESQVKTWANIAADPMGHFRRPDDDGS